MEQRSFRGEQPSFRMEERLFRMEQDSFRMERRLFRVEQRKSREESRLFRREQPLVPGRDGMAHLRFAFRHVGARFIAPTRSRNPWDYARKGI